MADEVAAASAAPAEPKKKKARKQKRRQRKPSGPRIGLLEIVDSLKRMKGSISAEDAAEKIVRVGKAKKVLSRPLRLKLEAFFRKSSEPSEVKKQVRSILREMRGSRGPKATTKAELVKSKPVTLKVQRKGFIIVGRVSNWLESKRGTVLVTYKNDRIEIRRKG